MTLEEKLGQLLMVACYGGFASAAGPEFQELARQIEQNHAGGLMLATRRGALGIERSQVFPTAALVDLLQQRAKIPLVVAADFERGTAMRLAEGTSFPHAMAVAATGSVADAYTVGRITAIEGRAVGVPWIFAPVADVNSDPDNPIINVRSFGEDPEEVSARVTAFIRGVEDHGGLATAKHFPGHGDTDTDSHLDLPTVDCDRAHLDRIDLPPFRAAIAAGVGTIMTGHIAVPALEPDENVPATLSARIATGLLRDEMRFDGVIVTDSLDMGGVTMRYSPAEAAVRSILAGADVLLTPAVPDAALAGLREAAASGRLPISRIDDAVTRVLRAKARLGLHRRSEVSLAALPEVFGRTEFARDALDIADRGVTLLRDAARLLPLDATRPMRALLVAIAGDPDTCPGEEFEREIRWRVDFLHTLRFDTRFGPVTPLAEQTALPSSVTDSVAGPATRAPAPVPTPVPAPPRAPVATPVAAANVPPAESYDVMIVALFVRVADRKGSIGLPNDQAEFVHRLLASDAGGKPVIVACFGSPYVLARFPEAKTWLAAFSNAGVAQCAAARAMFGEIAIGGRIPVNVPGAAALGDGLRVPAEAMTLDPARPAENEKFAAAFALLDRAVTERAFPGGVVAIGHRVHGERAGRVAVRAFGKQSYDAGARAATPDTIYDAASLTKSVVTATLAEMLVETGELDLNAPVARYIPEWLADSNTVASERSRAGWRAIVTVRHLMTHTSGLPAHEKYFEAGAARREIVAGVVAAAPIYEPGAQSVYSDLGFIVLGEIIGRLTGKSLDDLAQRRIFEPLRMTNTMFKPPESVRARIAPTEIDAQFRKRLVHGEVHDENAWAMGGVAGHAGMFATAGDLAIFCQMLLNGGIYAHRRLLRRSSVAEFTSAAPLAANTRTLGWNVPTPGSSSGRYFSARSFGHTGFTGTSIWVDPDKQLFVVLLTNRVHPSRDNDKINKVRPALHDAIVEALHLQS
jgi:beta-N-acetylhexosaminidase